MFQSVNPNQSFPEMELKIVNAWRKNCTFKQSLEKNSQKEKRVFFDGPPFANGMPHYGHLLQATLKDAMARYKTMRGFYVPRVAGWDCHGLPVENEVEKQENIQTKKDIEQISVQKFNELCRSSVFKYVHEFEKIYERMGRWVDLENAYATLDRDYMESIWWVFKQLWDKGLVYKGYKPMHISTALETPLSNFEVSQNYKDITDFTLTAKFELVDEPGTFILAWTTTPWTLPGNQALAINQDIKYVKVSFEGQKLILAEELLDTVMGEKEFKQIDEVKAAELLGKRYKPLFPYFETVDEQNFRILQGDFVNTEGGTGIVHIAGGFGEDDYNVVKENGMTPIVHVEINGNFKPEVNDFAGKYVKGQDQNIGKYLEEKGLLFEHHNYRHSYPHCWRTDTPLLNYVTASWFIKVTEIKDRLIANNQKINWQPSHLKEGRFGKWLEGARDWSVSRSRYWGCPIPVWENENGDQICVGSIAELAELTGGELPKREAEVDLHKPQVDEITFMHPDHVHEPDEKYLMRRVPDVFDCWFESGSMPYAQLHYPFENKELFEDNFPADFIIEAVDQTRGWFYTLHVLATALFDKPAFENVISTGHILAADGEKLSKRKKNFVDPNQLFAQKGVDAMRMFLYNSPVVVGEGVRFTELAVDELLKKFNLTIWNTYSFFVTYANIDGWKPNNEVPQPNNTLDKWILSELHALIKETTEQMEEYNMMKATRPMLIFIDNLSNWYIRRSRRRFWKSESDDDKNSAYHTLHHVLVEFSKLIAPFMPFLSEEIYQNLSGNDSVHLADWPEYRQSLIDESLNEEIGIVRDIVALGHAVRDRAGIKVRQPLAVAKIALPQSVHKSVIEGQKSVILEELNVKNIELIENVEGLVKTVLKPNAKLLGPRYGKDVQIIIQAAKAGDFVLTDDGAKIGGFELGKDEFEIGYQSEEGIDAENANGITVILETVITDELLKEGYARDIVRQIQELRKEADYKVDDRIMVNIHSENPISEAVTEFADYIARETLANEIQQSGDLDWDKERELELDGIVVKIAIKR